ncbi:MAG: DUF805 domain-containing protein [Methylococcales bacterium]|nr:DUF805 domain-containing protein [Methylococcales bacterium]
MNWYLEPFKKYADFSGRARRKEYWLFNLFNLIITVALAFLDMFTGTFNEETGVGLLSGIYTVGVLIPGLAVSIRRLHDTGHSGWWILVNLVPLLGALVFIYFMVLDSKPGSNEYGPSPKGL